MIEVIQRKLPRGSLFVGCNAFVALFIAIIIVGPTISHFSSRSEEIAENASLLSHFQNVRRDAKALLAQLLPGTDPFLTASEDRLASADLQASLKAIGDRVGVRFLGIRSVEAGNAPQLRFVAVNVELEAGSDSIREFIETIDRQSPMLFITSASLRSATDGDNTLLHADLKVQGAMRRQQARADGAEARSQ